MQLILISGLSGSGKSVALKALEDGGLNCIDNLPGGLLQATGEYLLQTGAQRVAIGADARSRDPLNMLPQQLAALRGLGIDVRTLFLEANTETLVKRFSETRRRHPLSDEQRTLPECIRQERELLSEVAANAHRIDTSGIHPNTLRGWIQDFIGIDRSRLTLLFQSFGFKNGIPLDADFVFDVRCLPNPHYDPVLRPLTGRDAAVADFLRAQADVGVMFDDIRGFIEKWLDAFVRDNRSYLTVALGCTGGQHRSVFMTEQLAGHFGRRQQILLRHRELR